MNIFSPREQIVETVHKLFVYTDYQKWNKIMDEVFTEEVLFDMSSLGMEIKKTTAKDICEIWRNGFAGIDAVNHLAGNILVTLTNNGESAEVFAYATATHFKNDALNGKTREYTGSYSLHLINTTHGWRIDQFRYTLKYMNGNLDLK